MPFTPKNIRSHFQHVFIIVRAHNPCTENVCYRYTPPHLGIAPPHPLHTQEVPEALSSVQAACRGRQRTDSWPRRAASCVSFCASGGEIYSHTLSLLRVMLSRKGA